MTTVKIWKAIPLNEYLKLTGEDQNEEVDENQENQNDSIVQFLSEKNQEKGRKILLAMQENDRFQWTETGDVMFDGKKIPHAHMADLLSFALKTLPIRNTKIAGIKEFTQTIKHMNVPRSLFAAPFLKYMDNDVKHDTSSPFKFKKFRETYLLK